MIESSSSLSVRHPFLSIILKKIIFFVKRIIYHNLKPYSILHIAILTEEIVNK